MSAPWPSTRGKLPIPFNKRRSLTFSSVANGSLSGEASAFKPSSAAKKHLLHDSMPDDGPLIVHSVRPGDKNNSKSDGTFTKHIPSAIGTKDAISPTQQKVYYTTDVVPELFIGGHYVKFAIPAGRYDYFKKHIGGVSSRLSEQARHSLTFLSVQLEAFGARILR